MDKMSNIDKNNPQELSVNNKENNQIDSPDKEIEISENLLTVDELSNQGYKKIHDSMAHAFAPLLQRVPNSIAKGITRKSIEKSFNEAVRGSFRCTLDPSMHLAHRKGQPDVFLGTGLDNASNKISGQASWTKNNSVLKVPATPEIISGVFNAMSIITSQYYLSEINNRLDKIDKRLNNLEQKLDDKDLSDLKSFYKTLQKIQSNYNSIKSKIDRKISYNNRIIDIIGKTDSLLEYFLKQIDNIKNSWNLDDDEKTINERINKINFYQNCSLFTQYINIFANSIEIGLNDIIDETELLETSKNIRDSLNNNIKSWEHTSAWEEIYITNGKAFNLKLPDHLLSGTAGFLGDVADSVIEPLSLFTFSGNLGKKAENYVIERLNDKNAIKKNNLLDVCKKNDAIISDFFRENLKIVDAIDEYRKQINAKTELVYLDGEWYFRRLLEKNPSDE